MKLFNAFLLLIFIAGCTKDNHQPAVKHLSSCDSTSRFTYADIRPIIITNCSGTVCHKTTTAVDNTAYGSPPDLSTYSSVADLVRQGVLKYRLLLPLEDPQHMPTSIGPQNETTGIQLADSALCKILNWINQGYPEK